MRTSAHCGFQGKAPSWKRQKPLVRAPELKTRGSLVRSIENGSLDAAHEFDLGIRGDDVLADGFHRDTIAAPARPGGIQAL